MAIPYCLRKSPMKLSRTAAYAIHALVHIARQPPDSLAVGHQVGRELSMPEGFLLRLLVALSRARILLSIKGPNGGYRLGRPAGRITLLEVIEAVEGPLRGTTDPVGGKSGALDRRLAEVFDDATDRVRRQLAAVSVADLAGTKRRK